ncbi:MAG TPA: transcription antitermination factor NusB [Actinomycetota bacterium]|nr:transcription antitermination factor NusB [Actinomycetota bacterium]
MARRSGARRLAVTIVYQADMGQRSPLNVLEERKALGERIPRFTEDLVRGIAERADEIDPLIGEYTEGWTLGRLAAVDRAVLRVACYELLARPDVPVAVAIDEAVAAAKELSTGDSGRFVNGVLGRIARDRAGAG